MELQKVLEMWKEYKNQYNLVGWKFKLSYQMSRSLGNCRKSLDGSKKLIKLNAKYALESNEVMVRDTMLHEIAHALAPFGAGHGMAWKVICNRIGCVPFACHRPDRILRLARKKPVQVNPEPVARIPESPQLVYAQQNTETKMYLGRLCRKVKTVQGNNTVITYEPIG